MAGFRARIGWLERLESGGDAAPGIVEAIRAHQDRSERLIGWVQLAIVSAFAVLFTLAPKPLPVPIWERAALWILVAYGAFTLIRLALSYRMRLPPWVLGVSIIADMGLLIGLIFSFHIEYQQPPSFSLKAPTLLYVFIFIAIRALRFEARYVLLAGLTAAAGWGAMILYVLSGNDADMMITRNYVTYQTARRSMPARGSPATPRS
jgi:adenylate cyclase